MTPEQIEATAVLLGWEPELYDNATIGSRVFLLTRGRWHWFIDISGTLAKRVQLNRANIYPCGWIKEHRLIATRMLAEGALQ